MPETGALLIALTDPKFLAAAGLGLALVIYVIATAVRSQGQAQATGGSTASADKPRQQAGTAQQAGASAKAEQAPASQEESKPTLKPGKGRTLAQMAKSEEIDDASILSRFVLNAQGDTVGETMALTDEQVVLKTGDGFAAVSLEAIIEKDGMLLVDANIDWEQANEAGEQWRKASMDEMQYDESGMPLTD